MDANKFIKAKETLRERLKIVEDELNRYLASDYGVNVTDKAAFTRWLKSHQPFHWFIEFYGTINSGGFDVIIGNPPYLEYSKVKDYSVRNYSTDRCANLYAYTVERSSALCSSKGRTGMIIPISVACSSAMESLRDYLFRTSRTLWLSHFSNRPGQLFTGAQNRLTIFLARQNPIKKDGRILFVPQRTAQSILGAGTRLLRPIFGATSNGTTGRRRGRSYSGRSK